MCISWHGHGKVVRYGYIWYGYTIWGDECDKTFLEHWHASMLGIWTVLTHQHILTHDVWAQIENNNQLMDSLNDPLGFNAVNFWFSIDMGIDFSFFWSLNNIVLSLAFNTVEISVMLKLFHNKVNQNKTKLQQIMNILTILVYRDSNNQASVKRMHRDFSL